MTCFKVMFQLHRFPTPPDFPGPCFVLANVKVTLLVLNISS